MSSIEHEAKVLNIDVADIRAKLQKLGAVKKGDYTFRRYVFDTIPINEARWVRLRSDGHTTTLAIKEYSSNTIDGTEEWEIEVSDVDMALVILEKIGITPRGYQENTREEYTIKGATIAIDHWPKLKPYIEIEAQGTEAVIAAAASLGFDKGDLISDNTTSLYKEVGIDLKTLDVLKFEEGEYAGKR